MAEKFSKPFYNSKQWKEFRAWFFESKFGICEKCGKPGDEVHHKIFLTPQNVSDPAITLSEDNCMLLCRACHSEEHERALLMHRSNKVRNYKPGDNDYKFVDGNIVPNDNVFIVYGAPGSGKTTYVKKHKGKFDIVIDLDYIKNALTLGNEPLAYFDVLPYSIAVRDMLYDLIQDRRLYFDNAWIVAGLPIKRERNALAKRLKAKLIHIDCDKQECIDHVLNDDTRARKLRELRYIDEYFEKYEP